MSGAFQACFTDLRLVKGRKCVQLVFEVPVEHADRALEILGGMPDPSKSAWCGIARINAGATAKEPPHKSATEVPHEGSPGSSPEPSRGTSRLVQQAAMCCADPVFREFLRVRHSVIGLARSSTPESSARFVREWCGIQSRSEILPGTPAAEKWDQLYSQFLAWRKAA